MSVLRIEPYLFFNGRAQEAIDFYQDALNAEIVNVLRFNESPEPLPADAIPKGFENKIMHALIKVGQNNIMISDGCETTTCFKGFALCINVINENQARTFFDGLSVGGKVQMPLGKTFWSPCFGQVTDRFGVSWMINLFIDPAAVS